MKQVKHIFLKEFKSYFISPIAYIVISLFLLVTGWFFFATFFLYSQATLRSFFAMLPLILSFVVPAITMRLFSEEMNIGSYETLITMSVTNVDVILGKFFGAVAFISVMLVPTILYPVTVSFISDLDWGPVIGGYVGVVFLGAAFSAIGLFASSLTRNQIIAFIIGIAVCFTLTLIDKMLFFMPVSVLGFFEYIGADYHFQNFSKGVIELRDIVYFLSVSFISLYGANLVIQGKK